MGDWGLGIAEWAQSLIPNPQSPIPNPHAFISIILFILTLIINIHMFLKKNILKLVIKQIYALT